MRKLLQGRKIWTSGRAEWALFLLLFFSASYFRHPVEYDNTLSRYFLLSALVDYRRVDIGMYPGQTIDVSTHQGRTYSAKAIMLPLLAAPVYWAMRRWTPLKKLGPLSPAARYLSSAWAVALPFALAGPILFQLLIAMGVGAGDAFLAVVAYALGTIAWIHASLFSGHATAGSFVLFSFAACRHLGRRPDSEAWRWFGAGLLAGMAALSEYTAAYIAGILAIYVFRRARRRKEWAAFLAGGGVCLAVLLEYNFACFGAPWQTSYSNLGGGFSDVSRHGFFGIAWPDPSVLLQLLFSPARGLFFIMPVLLMAVPGFVELFRRGRSLSAEAWALALIVVGRLAINAGYWVWHGGWTFGPRHLAAALPFLIIPMAFAIDRFWYAPLMLLSFAQVGLAEASMPHVPQYIQNPVVECLLPLFRYGYQADNPGIWLGLAGAWSLLPWLAVAAALIVWGWPEQGNFWKNERPRGSKPWGWLYGAACAAVLCGLALARSPRAAAVHGYNAKLLSDFYEERPSPKILAAISAESRLRDAGSRP